MPTVLDLSGNGKGVVIEERLSLINFATGDKTVAGKMRYLRVNGAGNIVMRPAGGAADVTIAAKDGEYVPITPGDIVRQTGTTVTSLHSMAGY